MGKSMVSCRFSLRSLRPIRWSYFSRSSSDCGSFLPKSKVWNGFCAENHLGTSASSRRLTENFHLAVTMGPIYHDGLIVAQMLFGISLVRLWIIIYIYIYIYAYTYTCIYIYYIFICLFACIYLNIYIYIYIYLNIYIYVLIYAHVVHILHIYVHICTYVCICAMNIYVHIVIVIPKTSWCSSWLRVWALKLGCAGSTGVAATFQARRFVSARGISMYFLREKW